LDKQLRRYSTRGPSKKPLSNPEMAVFEVKKATFGPQKATQKSAAARQHGITLATLAGMAAWSVLVVFWAN
jgi:hypothetical protein